MKSESYKKELTEVNTKNLCSASGQHELESGDVS